MLYILHSCFYIRRVLQVQKKLQEPPRRAKAREILLPAPVGGLPLLLQGHEDLLQHVRAHQEVPPGPARVHHRPAQEQVEAGILEAEGDRHR